MVNSANDPNQSRWIVTPPEAGEVQFHLATGEGVVVTDDLRQAVEQLLAALQMQEVHGYASCFPRCIELNKCGNFSCNGLNNCSILMRGPCLMKMDCQIKRIV
jgi:hypothetical protein